MIITNNEEALRVKCEPVLPEEVGQLVERLELELDNSNRLGSYGIGLAAPQIGIAKDIAIVRLGNNLNINLVNCKIDKGYDPKMFTNEGCLSFPGRSEDTMRYQEICISNNLVYPHKFVAVGLFAVVCQHEIDHLNQSLFFDHKMKIRTGKVGPNDPCICGKPDSLTGKIKKFKKCCGIRK